MSIQVIPFPIAPGFHAFRVIDPLTGNPRHFTSREAAECFAARLEIAAAEGDEL